MPAGHSSFVAAATFAGTAADDSPGADIDGRDGKRGAFARHGNASHCEVGLSRKHVDDGADMSADDPSREIARADGEFVEGRFDADLEHGMQRSLRGDGWTLTRDILRMVLRRACR